MFNIPENLKPINLLAPAADAGGRTSAYISLKNAVKAWIVVHITQGAANTVQLDPVQATAVAGTSSKAVTAVPIWSNLSTAASDTLVSRTAAVNYTTDAGTTLKIVVFEIDPSACMDVANGFDCIGVTTGASAAANITAAQLYVVNKYAQATPPSSVTD